MIGWYTDNELSYRVLSSIPDIELKHIRHFDHTVKQPSIFYGILRGCARAMHILKDRGIDYHYIDNGYFDAQYVDADMRKDMNGCFRVVKNGMHEQYSHVMTPNAKLIASALVLPPSTNSATFYDTHPVDWTREAVEYLRDTYQGIKIKIREKENMTPLESDLASVDGVFSFNSMAVVKAVEMGKAVTDTHGLFCSPYLWNVNHIDLVSFYANKQFKLGSIKL